MRSSPVRAISASISIRRALSASPPTMSPPDASASSSPTTRAVVVAPTSAMISASSRRSHVSSSTSPSQQRRLDLGAERLARLGEVLAQLAKEAALALGLARPRRRRIRTMRRRSRSPSVMKRSFQSRAMAMRDDSAMALEFRLSRSDESPGRELMHELNDLLDSQYPGRVNKPGSVTTPDEMVPPHGAFLVGYEDGRPVAIGGLRRLEDGVCEIKRMYVVPDARSRGVGRALLGALEDAARAIGYEQRAPRRRSRAAAQPGAVREDRLRRDPEVQREPHRGVLRREAADVYLTTQPVCKPVFDADVVVADPQLGGAGAVDEDDRAPVLVRRVTAAGRRERSWRSSTAGSRRGSRPRRCARSSGSTPSVAKRSSPAVEL